jgi:hypothetical protein
MSDQNEALEKLGITNVRNASSNTTAAVSNIFEPPAELVSLPTRGYLYKDVTNDADILERGSVRVRPMTVNEEKILNTPRLVKSGQALDMIFRNCIKSSIDPGELTSSDRVYLMLWLRSVSYGNIYKFWIQSQDPSSQGKFQTQVDLSKHPITEFEDPNIREPFEVVLPASKMKVQFRLPRGKDEIEIMRLQNEEKQTLGAIDQSSVYRLMNVITRIELPDGSEVDKKMYAKVISSWIARDAGTLRNKLVEVDCGIQDIKVSDPRTGYEFETSIPITEDFFRVTE